MRILIAAAHRNLVGGVEKYLQAIIPGLRQRGHQLALLYEYPETAGRERIDPGEEFVLSWCLANTENSAALGSIAQWSPDIVYYHGFDKPASIAVEDALLSAHPVVLYVHNYDRTCGTGQKTFMFPQPKVCDRQIGPMCLLLHYPRRCGGLHPGLMWQRYRKHQALHARLPGFQAVLVGSRHMHRELEGNGVRPDHLHLLPLPATDTVMDCAPRPSQGFTGKILFAGRLTSLKGVDCLIDAMPLAARKLSRKLMLLVAGDGPEREKLQSRADARGVEIEFCGWLGTDEKLNLMGQVDLLAVPSLWPEPFGLVGLEAGGLGLPAVGFATGGIPDWLIGGKTGELAPSDPPTAAGLAEAIVRALASPEHYEKLRRGAWDLARQFTPNQHVDRLESLFLSLCSPDPGAGEPMACKDVVRR